MKNTSRNFLNYLAYFFIGLLLAITVFFLIYSLLIGLYELATIEDICESNYAVLAAERYEVYQSTFYTKWFCYKSNVIQILMVVLYSIITLVMSLILYEIHYRDKAEKRLAKTLYELKRRQKAEQRIRAYVEKRIKEEEKRNVEESRERMLNDHDIMGD